MFCEGLLIVVDYSRDGLDGEVDYFRDGFPLSS